MVLTPEQIRHELNEMPHPPREDVVHRIQGITDEARQREMILMAKSTFESGRKIEQEKRKKEKAEEEKNKKPKPAPHHEPHDDHGHDHETSSWQPTALKPILPQSNKEAFAEGAGIAATSIGTAIGTQAVFPGVSSAPLYASMGAGAALIPAAPGVAAALGYMIGNRYGKPMTGMALGGLTGAGGSLLALNALGATSAPAWPLLFPIAGTLGGYYLGKQLNHPMLGMATGTALTTYLTYAAMGGASLSLGAPIVLGAAGLGAAGLGLYYGSTQIKNVITGEASWYNPFNWAVGPFSGLVKGFMPQHYDKIHGIEHLSALPGKVVLNSATGIKKIFTHEAPEGFVQSVWTAPTRALSGIFKGFSGGHTEGFVENTLAKPGRFARWLFTPQGESGGH